MITIITRIKEDADHAVSVQAKGEGHATELEAQMADVIMAAINNSKLEPSAVREQLVPCTTVKRRGL